MRNAKSQREVISIHVGGAGCNLGGAIWELFCVEHGIDPEGKVANTSNSRNAARDSVSKNFFFNDKQSGKMVPRSIFLDLEPCSSLDPTRIVDEYRSPIDRIKTGACRNLFEPEQLLSHKQDALTFG